MHLSNSDNEYNARNVFNPAYCGAKIGLSLRNYSKVRFSMKELKNYEKVVKR